MSVLKFREQIYAGVLGKIIGVYLGRPVEGWSYDKIRETFDEVKYYVHEKVGVPPAVALPDVRDVHRYCAVYASVQLHCGDYLRSSALPTVSAAVVPVWNRL